MVFFGTLLKHPQFVGGVDLGVVNLSLLVHLFERTQTTSFLWRNKKTASVRGTDQSTLGRSDTVPLPLALSVGFFSTYPRRLRRRRKNLGFHEVSVVGPR